jgi:hypothetical protein
MTDAPTQSWLRTYRPLFVIVGMVALASAVTAGHWHDFMLNFMGGFFLVFSGLKLLDIGGFARGYARYDLLAAKLPAYGYLYPLLELALGLAYITRMQLEAANWVTLVLMLFSGLGVVASLARGEKFKCACMGTMINVPLTNVTLVEDFGMAAMAAAMLWLA